LSVAREAASIDGLALRKEPHMKSRDDHEKGPISLRPHLRSCLALAILLRCAPVLGAGGPATAPAPGLVRYEPFPIASFWGPPIVQAGLGRLRVRENRASDSPRQIELAFVRIPTTNNHPGTPIVWLSGGPGVSGTADLGTPALQLFLELARLSDVIVLDQRGTGLSVPRLDCPGSMRFPFEVAIERGSAIESLETAARACAQRWRAEGVDLSAYNVAESAEDIEELRLALGAKKLRLLAGSWGTHLALATIRAHGSVLERAALLGVVGPDHLYGSPADVEAQLVEISRLARRDVAVTKAFPDLLEAVRGALERLRREPRTVELATRDGGSLRIAVGAFELAWYTRSLLSSQETISHLPALLAAMKAGDFRELAAAAARWRFSQAPPASVFTARCSSGASPERLVRIERESRSAVLGETTSYAEERVCRAFGVSPLPASFRAPVVSELPVLFVSGTLDGDTPEENAVEVSHGFPNAERLRVEGAPHALLGFEDLAARGAIVRFFEGRHLRTPRVAVSPIVFERPDGVPAGSSLILAAGGNALRVPPPFLPTAP
jgi:pimeloyl-ACP methyl ester carboxylesterase